MLCMLTMTLYGFVALLILAALAQVEANEDCLCDALDSVIYNKIVSLARIYDLQLIMAALDCLYYLSDIGEAACDGIANVKHCIGQFISSYRTLATRYFSKFSKRLITFPS